MCVTHFGQSTKIHYMKQPSQTRSTSIIHARQNDLPPEIQQWINPQHPLPQGVRFFRVRLKSAVEIWLPISVGTFFLLMGSAAPIAFMSEVRRTGFTGGTTYLLFGAIFILLFLAVFLYGVMGGAVRDWQISRSAKKNQLRYGLFLNQHFLLARLPHEMHLFAAEGIEKIALTEKNRGQRHWEVIEIHSLPAEYGDPITIKVSLLDGSPGQILSSVSHFNQRA